VILVIGSESAERGMRDSIAFADANEFAALVQPYLSKMSNLAERLTNDSSRDDVVQEALINAWTKRAQFDPGRGALGSWLMAIVADQSRKAWRRRFVFFGRADRPESVAPEDKVDLEGAVSRLPERQRLAVDCFYFAGLNVAETAQVMRCSEGTVKSTLSDARRNLRADLEPRR
jgi:RNA polymerase sigma-70 factor (ECF subfamily)